ncbi:MAG TPA: glycosyltransferase family 2 protein, partial [Gemmatimonadales bacterium]|nr:glycosyltransferase family 2 protein [Gemmatimonadales bacterium]
MPCNLVSVVVPVYNEAEVIGEMYRRLTHVASSLPDLEYELVVVDDGSRDESYAALVSLARSDPRLRVLKLSRNFGHQTAITAGIDVARGDAVVIIDADLQDPPEVIPEMVQRWREGFDVVYGVRAKRAGE